MKKLNKKNFRAAKDQIELSPGEMLAGIRKLQKLTQAQLAKKAGMTQANISSLESGRQQIGRDRAITLAKALQVHPAVIMFPDFKMKQQAS